MITVIVNVKKEWQGKGAERPCSVMGPIAAEVEEVMVANAMRRAHLQAHSCQHP